MIFDIIIGQVTLLRKILPQGLIKHRNMTFEDTYKEPRAHE